MSLYLLLNIAVISIPLLFSFHKRIRFDLEWKYFIPAMLITASVFIFGDFYFTKDGIWGFNERYLSGIKFLNLPLEEVLFFICIPYACVFTYHVIRKKINQQNPSFIIYISLFLIIFLFMLAIKNSEKKYTVFACISSGTILLFSMLFTPSILKSFYISFLTLLIPFTIVNGILTGTGIESEVVWYNNTENLGIRVWTIPVEDFAYALSMILTNVFLMECFKKENSGLPKIFRTR